MSRNALAATPALCCCYLIFAVASPPLVALGSFVGPSSPADALAAIALRQNKFREDPEALEAFIQVALREIDANSDDVITVEEVEKWFDSLEEEVEDQ